MRKGPQKEAYILEAKDEPMPKVVGRGRKRRKGKNYTILESMVPGGKPVFGFPKNKMFSVKVTAQNGGYKLKIRRIPDSNLYAIQRLT